MATQKRDEVGVILVDRYQIQQQLNKKAGRCTVLAQDLHTQALVVIKLLTFSPDFEWDDLKLFEREAATLKALSHPAIPRYLDYFEIDQPNRKGFALVQTYIEAQSLEQHLKAGRSFSEGGLKQLAKDLLEILIYLHDRQPAVVHRDIKPSNILLADRSGNHMGQVYLVDFGSVQTLAAKEGGTITVVGTYGYMPPEQFGGRASPASDLYSLGATLIALATGQHPSDLPQDNLRLQFENSVHLSHNMTAWLQWITEPSLNQRLSSARQALQALEQSQPRAVNSSLLVQPYGSRITLTKTTDVLEILIPPTGLRTRFGFWTLLLVPPWFVLSTAMAYWLFTLEVNGTPTDEVRDRIVMASIFSFMWLPGVWAGTRVLFRLFSGLFGWTRIRFNQQQFSSTVELFRFRFPTFLMGLINWTKVRSNQTKVSSISEFFGLYLPPFFAMPKRRIQSFKLTNKRLGGKQGKKTKLIIQLDHSNQCELMSTALVTETELEWLAQELSHWVEVPLVRE